MSDESFVFLLESDLYQKYKQTNDRDFVTRFITKKRQNQTRQKGRLLKNQQDLKINTLLTFYLIACCISVIKVLPSSGRPCPEILPIKGHEPNLVELNLNN